MTCPLCFQIYRVLGAVENMKVYRRDEFPDRFHYKGGKFVSTLTLVAEPGWFITEVSSLNSYFILEFILLFLVTDFPYSLYF